MKKVSDEMVALFKFFDPAIIYTLVFYFCLCNFHLVCVFAFDNKRKVN